MGATSTIPSVCVCCTKPSVKLLDTEMEEEPMSADLPWLREQLNSIIKENPFLTKSPSLSFTIQISKIDFKKLTSDTDLANEVVQHTKNVVAQESGELVSIEEVEVVLRHGSLVLDIRVYPTYNVSLNMLEQRFRDAPALASSILDALKAIPGIAAVTKFGSSLSIKHITDPQLDDAHFLWEYAEECRRSFEDENPAAAQDALDSLIMELNLEQRTIAAAFYKFDARGDDTLHGDEIQFMMEYLGFPCTPADIKTLLSVMDPEHTGTVGLDEFVTYVGKMGGSPVLFAVRRRHMGEEDGEMHAGSQKSMAFASQKLREGGIKPDDEKHWKLISGQAELWPFCELDNCQLAAVRHIRILAQENHARALPKLQNRVRRLGYSDNDLWMSLAWIRELAPIIIHVDLNKIGTLLEKDTHYRNQFETNVSGGLKNKTVRSKWEYSLFGSAYNRAQPMQRPKYGVQNIWNDHRGVMGCSQYGDSYLVLKGVRLRSTCSPEDSANCCARKLSSLDFYAHVFLEYSDKELAETLRVASQDMTGGRGDSSDVIETWGKYKEVQIHGEIRLDEHVQRIVVHERHRSSSALVERIADKHGWELKWMDEMKDQIDDQVFRAKTADVRDWRLKHKQQSSEDLGGDDMCRSGCGRPCSTFSYCCAGCSMGFGHDLSCGMVVSVLGKADKFMCKSQSRAAKIKDRVYTTIARPRFASSK